ncbi:MAG: methyl-accepting chemotaxis protein [bacterium]|jgi:methyl-accepting chemotaxis protein
MNNNDGLYNSFVESWIPEKFKQNIEHHRSSRLLVHFSVAWFLLGIIYTVSFYRMGFTGGAIATVVCILLLITCPMILKSSNFVIAANYFVTLLFGYLTYVQIMTGGIDSGGVAWLGTIPVMAILIAGKKSGWFWGAAVILLFILLFLISAKLPESVIPIEVRPKRARMANFSLSIFLLILAQLFSASKDRAFHAFKKAEETSTKTTKDLKIIVQEVAQNAEKLVSTADSLSSTTKEMQITSNEIAEATERESENLQDSNNNIQEISSAFANAAKQIQEIQIAANDAETSASRGAESVQQTNVSMGQIEESSNKITGIISVITDISNQTNLLSLNAAIEAAKAGEFGKGFSVVADEVRRLAERSRSAVIEIRKLIEVSNQNVQNGNEVITETATVLNDIIEQIGEVSIGINSVTNAIISQSEKIQEINHNIKHSTKESETIATAAEELSATTTQVAESTTDINEMAESLNNQIARFKDNN